MMLYVSRLEKSFVLADQCCLHLMAEDEDGDFQYVGQESALRPGYYKINIDENEMLSKCLQSVADALMKNEHTNDCNGDESIMILSPAANIILKKELEPYLVMVQ